GAEETPPDPAHNPKVAGSNPAPAIEADQGVGLARALQTGRLRAKATARWPSWWRLDAPPFREEVSRRPDNLDAPSAETSRRGSLPSRSRSVFSPDSRVADWNPTGREPPVESADLAGQPRRPRRGRSRPKD